MRRPRRTSSYSSCRRRLSLLVLLAALAFPAAASAHARLVVSKPADGAVLAAPPAAVSLLFDDAVRPSGSSQVVDARGRSVLAGPVAHPTSRSLVLPLRSHLPRGAYSVRWQVLSDDGHVVSGVLAFAVGPGAPRPVSILHAGGGVSGLAVFLRVLFFAGVLVAGGAALAGRRLGGSRWVVPAALVLVAAGAFGLVAQQPGVTATRFGTVMLVAGIVAVAGAAAGVVFRPAALAAGIAVLLAPTLSGHALDPHRLRWLVALADLAHVVGAAVWIGGLTLLVAARGRRDRFPPLAAGAVILLSAAAVPRALAAFPSLASLFHTSYGQVVIVKTGLLAVILAVAWLNRARIAALGLAAELVLLAGVVVAVAVLTDLRPPQRAAAAAPAAVPARPTPPPADALVLAAQDDDVAVGLAVSPRGTNVDARVTVLGPDGKGIDGLRVRIGGALADPCAAGCYTARIPFARTIAVRLDGKGARPATLAFRLPARWPAPSATALVTRVDRAFRALRSVRIQEHLASSDRNAIDTVYRLKAPDEMTYAIRNGPQAVVIGRTRWDRDTPTGRWTRSEQQPIPEPTPFWGGDPRLNAHYLAPNRVSFYDPKLPAWFVLTVDPRSGRLLRLQMTAQAHFMRHRYSAFDQPVEIRPPKP